MVNGSNPRRHTYDRVGAQTYGEEMSAPTGMTTRSRNGLLVVGNRREAIYQTRRMQIPSQTWMLQDPVTFR
ncbi:hypothetical protein Y032_0027g1602 [Ancylostoma ceylanicum]|uniref:Uncharacterized protein n=1 Tax=Ancylostoma ceylanicum TaxID=53326 RepID=A0A016UVX3_9BILA|nr:hypothetical protein Y032_0027g1602 [Ancylostoma ceylanicum]